MADNLNPVIQINTNYGVVQISDSQAQAVAKKPAKALYSYTFTGQTSATVKTLMGGFILPAGSYVGISALFGSENVSNAAVLTIQDTAGNVIITATSGILEWVQLASVLEVQYELRLELYLHSTVANNFSFIRGFSISVK